MGIKYRPKLLNSREKMLICNFKGVFTHASENAFARLLGVTPSDIRWSVSPATITKARNKLRKETRK